MSVVSWGEGTCRLIEFIKQWTGETDGGHPSQCSVKSVEFPAAFFLSMDHFLGCIFPDSSQFAVWSCPVISPLTLLMLYTSASSQAPPRDPDLILKSTSCSGLRLLLRIPFDTVTVGAMVY